MQRLKNQSLLFYAGNAEVQESRRGGKGGGFRNSTKVRCYPHDSKGAIISLWITCGKLVYFNCLYSQEIA
jgi:hypothetical protein